MSTVSARHDLAWARLQLPRPLGVPTHWTRAGIMGQESSEILPMTPGRWVAGYQMVSSIR